jgi:hypothetical protein
MHEPGLAARAAAEGALAAARAAAQAQPAIDWICDRGGLHGVGSACDCTDDDDEVL